MERLKKILASALLVCMLVSMLPVSALAEGEVCAHSYTPVQTLAPTCVAAGVMTYACSLCGDSYTETIAVLDHSYLNATCTAPKTCKVCTATDGEPLGHDYADATCTAPRTCKVCTATEGEPLGHTAGETVTEPATCTVDGSITVKCSVCGEVASTEIISATGHTAGEETVTTEATCTTDGSKSVNCTVCDETYTVVIPATGHTPGEETVITEATCTTDGSKSVECTVCGEIYTVIIPATGHSFADATCTTPKTCTVCEAEDGYPLGHTEGEHTVTKEATCEEVGEEIIRCAIAGCEYSETVEIPALGHDYNEQHVCSRCGDEALLMKNPAPNSTSVTADTIEIIGPDIVYVGHPITFAYELTPADSNDNIIWSSSDTSIATVAQDGTVTGVSAGSVDVTASGDNSSRTKTITVTPIKVKKIEVSGPELIKTGETTTLTAMVLPSTAENRTIEWSSDKPSVATVNENGVVTGESTGTAIITATAKDGSGVSKGYMVYVQDTYNPYIYADRQTLYVGDTVSVELRHATFKNFTNVNWTFSGNDDEVEASGSGTKISVKAKKAGEVGISVSYTSNEGNGTITNGIYLTILSEDQKPAPVPVTSIEISGPVAVLADDTITLTAAVTPEYADDTSVTWTSSDDTTATVDENGVVTGVNAGTVTITATANGGANVSATHSVTVEEIAVSIDGASTVLTGGTITISAVVTPAYATDKSVTWSINKPDIATVDEKGVVKGVNAGTVTITATSNADRNKSASKEITVKAPSLTVSGPGTVAVGNTITLTAKVSPDEVTDKTVTWTSSDSTIATVDKNGVVKGVKTGEVVRIKATSNYDGELSAEHSVRVIVPVYLYYGNGTHFNGIHAMPFVSSDLWAGGAGVSVVINGIPLVPGRDFSCYSSPHGMIGVTVNPGLLRLLPQNAWHSIEIVSANGVAAGSFSTGYFGYYNIYGVKTGDDSTPLLWAALCLLGISGAGIILVKSRKRKA